MAKSYVPAGSSTTVKILSQTEAVDVEAIAIYTRPSNVRVVVPVPLADFKAGKAGPYLAVTAELIESLLVASPDPGQDFISGVANVQDIDSNGLLSSFLVFTVKYQPQGVVSAPFTAAVTLPVTSFETAAAFNTPLPGGLPLVQLTNTYARLKALAAS